MLNKFVVCFSSPCRDGSRACLAVSIGGALLVRQAVIGRGGGAADNGWLEAAVKWELKEWNSCYHLWLG